MTGDKAIYFGFIVLLLSVCVLALTLIATQPVIIDIDADIQGRFGDINTAGNAESPDVGIPKLPVSSPINGKSIELYNGTTISIPGFKIKSSFEGFNASVRAKGHIEAPVYVLAIAYMNRDKINITNGGN